MKKIICPKRIKKEDCIHYQQDKNYCTYYDVEVIKMTNNCSK